MAIETYLEHYHEIINEALEANFRNGKFAQRVGGFPGNMNGAGQNTATVTPQQQEQHLYTTLISILLLVAGCLVVVFWRRKSL